MSSQNYCNVPFWFTFSVFLVAALSIGGFIVSMMVLLYKASTRSNLHSTVMIVIKTWFVAILSYFGVTVILCIVAALRWWHETNMPNTLNISSSWLGKDTFPQSVILMYLAVTMYAIAKYATYLSLLIRLHHALKGSLFQHKKIYYKLVIIAMILDAIIGIMRLLLILHFGIIYNWLSFIMDGIWFACDTAICVLITLMLVVKLYQFSQMMHEANGTSQQLSFDRVRAASASITNAPSREDTNTTTTTTTINVWSKHIQAPNNIGNANNTNNGNMTDIGTNTHQVHAHAAAHRISGNYSEDITSVMGIIVRGTVLCMILIIWCVVQMSTGLLIHIILGEELDVIWILICIDCVVNTVLVSLYFNFTEKMYFSMCGCCHEVIAGVMQRCFG